MRLYLSNWATGAAAVLGGLGGALAFDLAFLSLALATLLFLLALAWPLGF